MISVTDVTVTIGDHTLLHDITFTARAGEVTGLIGPNGAGKSTMLAVLSGDLERQSGEITVAGCDPAVTAPQKLARARAVMLQDVTVSFDFLVRDVVAMGRRPWHNKPQAEYDDAIIDAALQATDTTHLAGRDISTLSGGERARVALARVLAQQTPVIMLDEPTAALDIKHQEQVLGLVRRIAETAGVAVIVVVHDLNAAAAYCDHIICLADGVVASAGPIEEVYTSDNLSRIYGWPIHVTTTDGVVSVQPARRRVTDNAENLLDLISERITL